MNPPRITPPAQQSYFGLVAWLEETRVALPLKGVECQFQVTGDVACVELDQIYRQDAAQPLDCTYTFPLPAGAAVYRCEVDINGRVIRARVEDKRDAVELYVKHKAEGRRVALVETERENLFTLSLGNVQPGDLIVVRFAWFQVLDRLADGLRLMVPTCPGVRYIPGKPLLRANAGRGTVDDTNQVPDASRISPPRIDALHPDAAYFSIEGRLSAADVEGGTASSPSHPVIVRENEGGITVGLADRATVPDRDFVLAWKEPKISQLAPNAWQWTQGNDTYALVQLRAPEDVQVAGKFPQDFYFLVDRSGSMAGAKWEKSCEALCAFVGLLGPEDRVWITLFESSYLDFDVAPMPAPQVLADEGFRGMSRLGTAGGTELLPAATHVLQEIAGHSKDRRANVILITDGQVGNEREIEDAFKLAANVTVHTFGIDTAVNDAFLKSLARQHRGNCWLQTPDDDIAGTITALGDRLRRPVLSELAVTGSWEAGNGALPDIHAREVVAIALRGKTGSPVKITGRLPDGAAHSLVVNPGNEGSEALKFLWARQRIGALLASGQWREAVVMAKEHNLICEGTAFIAWDEQEQVPIAKYEVVQPVMLAACEPLMKYSPRGASRLYSRSPRVVVDYGDALEVEHAHDEPGDRLRKAVERKRVLASQVVALREALPREGVPRSNIERFIAWAESGDALGRTAQLNNAMELVAQARQRLGAVIAVVRTIQQVLSGPPEALVQWAEEFRPPFEALVAIESRFLALNTGQALLVRIRNWVAESGKIDPDRLGRISKLLQALERGTFSTRSRERLWREFLDDLVASAAC